MKNGERGAVSTLVLITVFCFTTILIGAYVAIMVLAQAQQKSNLKIQQIYGDDINQIENIYSQIQKNNSNSELNEEETTNNSILQTELRISNESNENLTYRWKIESKWGKGIKEEPKCYKIIIDITNYGETQNDWEIKFDVQSGIAVESCNVWSASSTEVSENTVTMKCQPWNAQIQEGTTLTVDFILAFDNEQELRIDNFYFNGKKIEKE